MKATAISNCYVSPAVSMDEFIPEHFFLYLLTGSMLVYDGNKEYKIKAGDYGLARRNHLAKYSKQRDNGAFRKVVLTFDQPFLKTFIGQHPFPVGTTKLPDAIIPFGKSKRVESFIQSLTPYFNADGAIEADFFTIKRSELLLILLKEKPELANILFDFSAPEKIDLEEYMNRNFRFNVSIERFAYLTGRSLTSYKREFQRLFNDTPRHWLMQKRLLEAHYLIGKKGQKASDIYLELGFEDLSHFSFAFRKKFGVAPTELGGKKKV